MGVKKMQVNISEVAMRFVKIPLLWLVLVAALAASGWAQDTKVIGCNDLVKSSFDELRIRFNEGPASAIALVPVSLHHDSICTAFQFLVEYDTNFLSPVYVKDSSCAIADSDGNCTQWNVDSSFVEAIINQRFVKTKVTQGPYGPIVDTITKFRANLFQGKRNIVACNFLPEFDDIDSLAPPNPNVSGDDTIPIFYLKFNVKPGTPHMTLCEFTFYENNIWLYCDTCNSGLGDSTQVPGCYESQMTTIWKVGDSSVTYQIYPETDFGYRYYYRVNDSIKPAPTVTLDVTPSSITQGSTADLTWSSTNADSVVVRIGTTRVVGADNGKKTGTITLTGLAVGTYSYTATAYGNSKTGTDGAVLIVNSPGQGPVISVSSIESSYDQGELVSFTVTATNTNASQITLRATSLPSNASFGISGQVTGMTPLMGSFSWTPDYNQDGQFVITFQGTDNGGTTYRNVIINIEKLDFDRLFSTSAKGSHPVGGLPGTRDVRFPIDLITSKTVYGVQFDMKYPSADIRIDSVVASPRVPTPDYWDVRCVELTPGSARVIAYGLNGEAFRDTNTTAILYAFMTIDNDAEPWSDCEIILSNGRESVTPDANFGGQPLVTDTGVVEVDRYGDVNLDRYVDVADAVNIVAYIIGNYTLAVRQFASADIVTNDSVNVFDLVADINLIFNIDAVPSPAPSPDGKASIMLAYDDLSVGSSDYLTVASELPTPVAGAQFEINYDPSAVELGAPRLTSAVKKFALRSNDDGNGHMRILLYNMAPSQTDGLAQAGLADLVEVPITARRDIKSGDKAAIRLTQALLSTSEAAAIAVTGVDAPLPTGFALSQNYPNPFNPTTTIEYTVGAGDSFNGPQDVQLDIFNVLGQHVTTLVDGPKAAGDYRIEWNATDKTGQRVATGIYLYRLNVGNESVTKKMLFLK
jgi:hypothetical protein